MRHALRVMCMGAYSDQIAELGVHRVASLVLGELGWKFRRKHESDYGIDAEIESVHNGRPAGKAAALQIKSGRSYFTEEGPGGGWVLRGPKRHPLYWLEYQMPVLVVLLDPSRAAHTGRTLIRVPWSSRLTPTRSTYQPRKCSTFPPSIKSSGSPSNGRRSAATNGPALGT